MADAARPRISQAELFRLAIAVGAAALLGALVWNLILAGDEPPIRVKGGSIEMDIVHNSKQWRQHGSKKKWKLSSGGRDKDAYLVYVATTPNNASKCTKNVITGYEVVFTHNDGKSVAFKSESKKTFVTSPEDLDTIDADKRKLAYVKEGYIATIKVDGTAVCTFDREGQLDSVLLTEEP